MSIHRMLAGIALLAAALLVERGLIAQQTQRHVVMISIDGLKPTVYTAAAPSQVPTLRRLARQGVWAEGVTGSMPTSTYPSHTTIVTGVPPSVHGIYNNRVLDPEDTSNGAWYWYARDIKVPTLYGAVKAAGLRTAAVSWPVTVDADIDYLMPEFGGGTSHPIWLSLVRALSKPRHLLDVYEDAGHSITWEMTDTDRVDIAIWMLRTYHPALLLLHIYETDDVQHAYGPGSPEALTAIEAADANVRKVTDAVAAAGLEGDTDIVVLSDHGFLGTETQLQPNFAFKRDGLLEVDARGRITRWDAYFQPAGGSGFVMLSRPDDRTLQTRVRAVLDRLQADPANGISSILTRADLDRFGADPRASFGIDMKSGFYTAPDHDVLLKATRDRGGHGFTPDHVDLRSALIMAGPDVPPAGDLGVVRLTQIGPTVASWFGVSISPRADAPLTLEPATSGR
ncbi:MAG: ectonucleotide pyrophosphatase/phosphodiesterase [Vicinamibacterales bacterium]